jgi:hypothetical protein
MKSFFPLACLLAGLTVLSGCASMDIQPESVQISGPLKRPSAIYYRTFDPGTDWVGDFGGQTKADFIKSQMDIFNDRLNVHLGEVAPTQAAPAVLPATGYLVTGVLTHVDAGSGAARFWAGAYGAGQREVTAQVLIYDLSVSREKTVASFKITGGSKGEGGIEGAVSNLDEEWDRIAFKTRDFLLDHAPKP